MSAEMGTEGESRANNKSCSPVRRAHGGLKKMCRIELVLKKMVLVLVLLLRGLLVSICDLFPECLPGLSLGFGEFVQRLRIAAKSESCCQWA